MGIGSGSRLALGKVTVGAAVAASSKGHRLKWGLLRCQGSAPVYYSDAAVETLLDLHLSAGIVAL